MYLQLAFFTKHVFEEPTLEVFGGCFEGIQKDFCL